MQMQALARKMRRSSLLAQLFPFLSSVKLKPHISPHFYSDSPSRAFARTFHRALLEHWHPHFSPLKSFCSHIYHGDPVESREQKLVHLLRAAASLPLLEPEAMESLESSGIDPALELVCSLIEKLKEEWRPALLAFKWGQKRGCVNEKVCCLMINVLGCHQKFSIAWCLIRDFHRMKMDTRRAMLVMIDRYAAANNPSKAIWTFQLMEKFRIVPDEEAFHALLKALCEHGNIEEAEEFMLLNKKLFPLETEGFNIILNGWCSINVDIAEAKRVWKEMSKCCILPNAASYTHMISCFSKFRNLFDSLRLYDEMKKRGWTPGLDVYNSLIYVLTQESCLPEALKILGKIKELGLKPNHTTYDSMIRPLCKTGKLTEARGLLSSMLEEKIEPTVETYHAFLECMAFEGTLEVLDLMRKAGLGPNGDTFLLIFEKFLKLNQAENALKVWVEMREYEMEPSAEHYRIVVCGLATSGYLIKANEIYSEMISKGFSDDPKLKKLLKKPSRGSRSKRKWHVAKRENQVSLRKGTTVTFRNHRQRSNERRRKKKSNGVSTLNAS
ncbi:pentatricopeptide repeat-containing protein At1g80880, mitochondrial [Punica granatum]|uniref:RGS domain-containing protein n=2 Tax=Punica granatum TaxID=22663 RepID=A0A218XAA9_PUNGR|nr:pentatricopeptide repeat-containing protein At1g80880, mitochondrial [Punica granatum]XP_031386125.1 pentatricopeptide repeat-containing protein At1g80880, mitochondrial [Punica granatum]OWM81873.1 hypothetical protein CDL15_Pgr007911 [Punica granatum]PKI65973.1 hypothetical protein CRG98_013639 [Punica granatum]